MRTIKNIIIHCSASPNGKDFDIRDCDQWHIERGFHRKESDRLEFNPNLFSVGYHFWIKIDGTVQSGRNVNEIGAHCSGLNSESIGICMCGTDRFSKFQWLALSQLVEQLQLTYPGVSILGHYQTPTGASQGKKCPEFDVPKWSISHQTPQEHVLI